MTWTIAYEMDFQGDGTQPTSINQLHDGGPYEYHFETFLPAHGWTVTNDEKGGGSFTNAGEKTYGIEKTFTYADGRTFDVKYIVELEYNQSDTNYFPWDGSTGAGIGTVQASFTSGLFPSSSESKNWKWLVSDEHTDAWILLGNNEAYGWSIPREMYVVAPDQYHTCAPVNNNNLQFIGAPGVTAYFNHGSTFESAVRVLNPNFFFSAGFNGTTYGFNNQTDMLLKTNGTTSSQSSLVALDPASVLIGSDYWLDLKPSSSMSLLLKTGAVDFGVL